MGGKYIENGNSDDETVMGRDSIVGNDAILGTQMSVKNDNNTILVQPSMEEIREEEKKE